MKRREPRRVKLELGGQKITKVGVEPRGWRDSYHTILGISWERFFLFTILAYLFINLAFSLLYYLDQNGIVNANGHYLNYLFFSIETISTVGYGHLYPTSMYAHVVSSVEVFLGLLGVALLTGLIFARFSRPNARMLFSKVAVITPFNGVPTLMVRVANERHNLILEADVSVTLIRRETTKEGHSFRRQYDLELARRHSAAFTLSWTILHPIKEGSPLFGYTSEELADQNVFLAVSIWGLDDVLEHNVHARHEYQAHQIRFNERFVDVLLTEGGESILDLTRFSDTIPDKLSPHPHASRR